MFVCLQLAACLSVENANPDDFVKNIRPETLFLNSLPNNKILDWFKLKAFADYTIDVNKNLKSGMRRVENIVGKGENAVYQHFLLFLRCFQKASFSRSLKVGILWSKVNVMINENFCLPYFS